MAIAALRRIPLHLARSPSLTSRSTIIRSTTTITTSSGSAKVSDRIVNMFAIDPDGTKHSIVGLTGHTLLRALANSGLIDPASHRLDDIDACSSECEVHIAQEWLVKIPSATYEERYVLTRNSRNRILNKHARLGCQVVLSHDLQAQWWSMHGSHVPLLAKMAMKILNLTCTSSGCERNWSTFEMIHTKKRNRLEQGILNDLVYVQYNARFRQRREEKNRDPLCAKNMDEAREWLNSLDATENDVVPGTDLTWSLVDEAAGASTMAEPRKSSRRPRASTSQRVEDEEPILASEDDTDEDEDEDEDAHLDLDAISSEDDGEKSDD